MFVKREELEKMGFKHLGKNVMISDKASIYSTHLIELGDNVRIDDFCVISPGSSLKIGNNVHIAVFSSIIGKGDVIMEDFSGLSSRVAIYSSTDDYGGSALTNPTVPEEFTNVFSGTVHLKKHVIIGAGSVVLPGVTLEEGVAVGALSLVNRSCEAFKLISGIPAKVIKERKQDLLIWEQKYLESLK
jgi:acetyltransferase-like isoleucine patch superfamily enzyme